MNASWSDCDEDDHEEESEDNSTNFLAFTTREASPSVSKNQFLETECSNTYQESLIIEETGSELNAGSHIEFIDSEQQVACNQMYTSWVSLVAKTKSQDQIIVSLKSECKECYTHIKYLKVQLVERENRPKTREEDLKYANLAIHELKIGATKLDQVLNLGKPHSDKTGNRLHQ